MNYTFKTMSMFDEIMRGIAEAKTIEQIEELLIVAECADKEGEIVDLDLTRLSLVSAIAKSAIQWKALAKEFSQTTP